MKKIIDSFLQRGGACLVVCILLLLLCLPIWPEAFSQVSKEQPFKEVETLAQQIQFPSHSPDREIGVTESILNNDAQNAVSVHYPVIGLEQVDAAIQEKIQSILSEYQDSLPAEAMDDFSSSLWVDYSSYLAGDSIASLLFRVEKNDSTMSHPDVYVFTMNFDLAQQKLLSLEDILQGEYLLAICDYTREYFSHTQPYQAYVHTEAFQTGSAPVMGNFVSFTMNDKALTFYFQKYRIFPGYLGVVSISIPYSELNGYLKVDTSATLLQIAQASGTISSQLSSPVQNISIDPSRPMIALTFDDGPHAKVTPQILEILKQNQAKATFFVVGNRVDSYADLIQREYMEGHEIGNHTYSHPLLTNLSADEVIYQTSQTDQRVANLTSYTPKLLRPPYGAINTVMESNIQKPFVLWSIDTLDWKTQNKTKILNEVLGKVKDGDIILMHDLYPSTAEACAELIPTLKAQGFQFVTVSELLAQKRITPVAGHAYHLAR